MKIAPPHRTFTRLSLEPLEDRSNPSKFAVQLTSGVLGIHGDTAGTVIGGGLSTNPALQPNNSGVVYVETANPQEAIRETLTGTIQEAVNGTTTTYTFNPATAHLSPIDHTAFVVTGVDSPPNSPPPPASPPGVTDWKIGLEDLTNFPAQSDWDYNDWYWTVRVIDVTGSYGGNAWFISSAAGTADPPPADPPPTMNLRVPTRDIMVNANNDNWNPNLPNAGLYQWKSDQQKYIPGTRDFDVSNLWQDDPQLVPVTITSGGGPGGGVVNGSLSFSQSYNNGIGSGTIKLWSNQRKQFEINGPLQIFANNQAKVITVYIEGVVRSDLADGITLHATFTPQANPAQAVTTSVNLTVGPIVDSLTTDTGAVRFFNGTDGRQGMQAGMWLGIGNPGNASGYKATATVSHTLADVGNANSIQIGFVQNLTDIANKANGSAAGAVNTVAAQNKNLLPVANSGITLPGAVLDSGNPNTPFQTLTMNNLVGSTFTVRMEDSPEFPGPEVPANNTTTYDVRDFFKTYLVVVYADGSIYTLGTVTWKVNFYATKSNANGTWADTIEPTSAVSVTSTVPYTNVDPGVTVGPIISGNVLWQ